MATPTIKAMPAIVLRPGMTDVWVQGLVPGTAVTIRVDGKTLATGIAETNGTFSSGCRVAVTAKIGGHAIDAIVTLTGVLLVASTFQVADKPAVKPLPKITAGPGVSAISTTGAAVSWSLDQKCTGQVEYGPTATYGQTSLAETSFNYSDHMQALTGLQADTTYHFRVVGKNATGQAYASADMVFHTAAVAVPPTPPPYVPPPSVQRVTPPVIEGEVTAPSPGTGFQAWLAGVPAKRLIKFPYQAVYDQSTAILLNGRTDLDFDLNGSRINFHGLGYNTIDSAFHFGKGGGAAQRICIRNFELVGDNPTGATHDAYHGSPWGKGDAGEYASGFQITVGPKDIEVVDGIIRDTYGHGAYVSSGGVGKLAPERIWLHRLKVLRAGVMGLNVGVGKYVWFEENYIEDTAIAPIDLEDGQSGEILQHIYLIKNTLNRWGWNQHYTGHGIVFEAGNGMSIDDVVADGNILQGGYKSDPGNQGAQIFFGGNDIKNHLQIIHNRGIQGAGPLVSYTNAPGVVESDNLIV